MDFYQILKFLFSVIWPFRNNSSSSNVCSLPNPVVIYPKLSRVYVYSYRSLYMHNITVKSLWLISSYLTNRTLHITHITKFTHFSFALKLFGQICNPHFFINMITLNRRITCVFSVPSWCLFSVVVCSGKMTWAYTYNKLFCQTPK